MNEDQEPAQAGMEPVLTEVSLAEDLADETPSDPWFNPYRLAATERAQEVVREIAGQLQVLERYHSLRQRKRRPEDQQRFDAIVAALVADLIHHYLSGSPGDGLVVTRSKNVLAKALVRSETAISPVKGFGSLRR